MKQLILNADDFCLSEVFNGVIIKLINESAISSTSVMIDRYTDLQRNQINELKSAKVGIGLHVEFTSSDNFETEIKRQYNLFKEIFQQEPVHLDIHKTEYLEFGYPTIMKFATEQNLPYANHGLELKDGKTTSKKSIGAIHNSLDEIITWLNTFDDNDSGELVLHPGIFDPLSKTSLNYERTVDVTKAREIKKYCNSNNIKIISFSDL